MTIFKPERSYIEKLQDKSASALDIFKKTIVDLSGVNFDAQEEIEGNTQEVQKLLSDNEKLTSIVKGNSKIIDKIESFLNE